MKTNSGSGFTSENDLAFVRNHFADIIDALKDAIFIVKLPERRIEYANRSVQSILGYPPETCIGRSTEIFYPDKESFSTFAVKLQQAIAGGDNYFNTEHILQKQTGEQFTAEISITFLQDDNGTIARCVSILRDISDRKRLEAELKDALSQYRTVVEDQSEVISRFRPDGTFTFVNPAYCRFFGVNANDILGRKWETLVVKEDLAKIQHQLFAITPDNPTMVIENRVFDAQGKIRSMQFINRGFFDTKGQVKEIQSVGRDITELKQKERQLHKVNSALEVLLERRDLQIERLQESIFREYAKTILPHLTVLEKEIEKKNQKKTVSMVIRSFNNLLSPHKPFLTSEKYGLTKTELKTAVMIRDGMTSREIAENLCISVDTVGFHRKNIRKKLGLKGSAKNLSQSLRYL